MLVAVFRIWNGSLCFRVSRIRICNQCCGSGSGTGSVRIRNFWPEPDPIRIRNRIRNKAVNRSLIFRPNKGNFRQLWNISTFSMNNLTRISIFATQFTGNWLTDNRIIYTCTKSYEAMNVNFVTRLRSTAARARIFKRLWSPGIHSKE
jgi:hypothetical protein